MAKKYGVASDYIKYTSRIKSDTSDGVAVEASQVVDLEEDKLQSDINKELKASIASASGNTYSKSEIDGKDTATLTSAKSYADTKKTEAVSAAATDAATKANAALASAKSYADEKFSALGSVYTTKGSCTAAQLKALTSAKAGDVWNITDAVTIDGKAYPAGVNVVCVTAFSAAIDPAATKNWDALQGLQDLTGYAKKSEIEDVAGKIGDVKIEIDQDLGYAINKNSEPDFGTSVIGKNANIGISALIGENAKLGRDAVIQEKISIGTNNENNSFHISREGTSAAIGYNVSINKDVVIGTGVSIGSDIKSGQEGSQQNIFGVTMGPSKSLGVDISGNFIWETRSFKKTAATTDDLSALATRVSALATRVSALEDLLKLA
jgi:acetyltransferase-like isoleucine patch superfamily enzyme|nr:MAG TPA: hypothetical protein [Caudoviricetes sp.]